MLDLLYKGSSQLRETRLNEFLVHKHMEMEFHILPLQRPIWKLMARDDFRFMKMLSVYIMHINDILMSLKNTQWTPRGWKHV